MKIYTLKQSQQLPITLEEAWAFFSTPVNLGTITPASMHFKILSVSGGAKTYAGQLIRYKISLLPLVTFQWVTEITHVEAPVLFVDEQRFGPFAFWNHQHRFREINGGVEMTDELTYAVPLGILGRIAHVLFVGPQVNAIFEHRTEVLKKLFPGTAALKNP